MIETERLILRSWRASDLDAYAAINADAAVMEHFPATLSRAESAAAMERSLATLARHGWGNWAVERRADGRLLGHVGIRPTEPNLPFDGAFEAGWRLARDAWGEGYATEASRAMLAHGFDRLDLPEILAFTSLPNLRSQAVMRRIGMTPDPARDFDHPALPPGHRLERHVLYAIRRPKTGQV